MFSSSTKATRAEQRLRETQLWLDSIVIDQKLCPFAAPVRSPPKLKLVASASATLDGIVEELASEADELRRGIASGASNGDGGSAIVAETTLLVLNSVVSGAPLGWSDLVSLSWRLQNEVIFQRGHGDHLQLVLFHPEATHSTYADPSAPPDAGDFTIRSPHPTIHLLREMDVLRAVGRYPDAAGIPGRNRARLRRDGADSCRARLEQCRGRGDGTIRAPRNRRPQGPPGT